MKEPNAENDTSKFDEIENHSIPSFIREFAARKQSRGQKGLKIWSLILNRPCLMFY